MSSLDLKEKCCGKCAVHSRTTWPVVEVTEKYRAKNIVQWCRCIAGHQKRKIKRGWSRSEESKSAVNVQWWRKILRGSDLWEDRKRAGKMSSKRDVEGFEADDSNRRNLASDGGRRKIVCMRRDGLEGRMNPRSRRMFILLVNQVFNS